MPMQHVFDVLYKTLVDSVENTVVTYAQTNPLLDAITNYMAANNIFDTDELIGFRDPTKGNRVWFYYSRKLTGGAQPISTVANLNINPNNGQIAPTGETIDLERRSIYNPAFQKYGGLAFVTGDVLPNEITGDTRIYQTHIENTELLIREAVDVAYHHYEHNANSIGTDQFGREWFVANVPRTDNPVQVFDPRQYDIPLANSFLGTGIAYNLMEPFFHVPKKMLLSFNAQSASRDILLDPLIQAQLETAKHLQRAAGSALIAVYPILALGSPLFTSVANELTAPVYEAVGDVVNALEGLFSPDPYNPQQAVARTSIRIPPNFELTSGGVWEPKALMSGRPEGKPTRRSLRDFLSEAGPISDGRIWASREMEMADAA